MGSSRLDELETMYWMETCMFGLRRQETTDGVSEPLLLYKSLLYILRGSPRHHVPSTNGHQCPNKACVLHDLPVIE